MSDEIVDMETLLEDICGDCNYSATVREDYSGRAMYGKKCWGIVADDLVECIERAAERGLSGARYDSMGNRVIVYWPNPEFTQECLEHYGIDETESSN